MKEFLNTTIGKWLKLIFSFAMLFVFAFVVVPFIAALPGFEELVEHNEKQGIEAGSLFYTETPSFEQADNYFRNSRR